MSANAAAFLISANHDHVLVRIAGARLVCLSA